MAVTAIKGIDNSESTYNVVVENKESGQTWTIEAGAHGALDVWIPHCASHKDFRENHYVTINVVGHQFFKIWQHDAQFGDHVRFVTGEGASWRDNAPLVYGHSSAGGDRTVKLKDRENIKFNEIAS